MSLILKDEIVERILIKKTCKSKTKSTKWTRIRFDIKKNNQGWNLKNKQFKK